MKQAGLVATLVLAAVGSLIYAGFLWSWVLNFEPGFAFNHRPAPTGPALSSSVTILLVDGLRLDASRRMPALNALRARGADIEAQVGTPSFSRPGRATLAVGAPPDIHGVTTNRQQRALEMDNLLRRVGAIGGSCRVAGSRIWSGLFAADIAKCGVYRAGEGKEGPGAFLRQVPAVRAAQREGLAFVLLRPATLRIADIVSTDFAAHEYGGTSSEYEAEVLRTDKDISDLVARLDLSQETLVVTSDHGHRDIGGHGGQEPEVLAIPVVMVGAGIRPGTRARGNQADIAPTIAGLLGAGLPAGSSGHPLPSVLLGSEEKLAVLDEASVMQARAFEDSVSRRLGIRVAEDGTTDWPALLHTYRDRELSRRSPLAILLSLAIFLGAVAATRLARPNLRALSAGLAAAVVVVAGPIRWLVPPLSFSAINYDEELVPFFARIMLLASVATVSAIAVGAIVDRSLRAPSQTPDHSSVAGSIGTLGSAALAGVTLASWLHHGLLLPLALPAPNRMVEAFAFTLAIASVSITSLVLMPVVRFLPFRKPLGKNAER